LRDEWFALTETPDTWTDDGPIGEGESESIRVINDVTKIPGAAKPGPKKGNEENHCRAAHEKLAFDLSCLIGLTVCPVVLWNEGIGAQYKRGRSISAWAFQQSDKWDLAEARKLISLEQRISAGPMISAMRVFHTWIGDTDRKPSHIHIDTDSPANEIALACYDHANAFSHSWSAPNVAPVLCADYMKAHGVPESHEVMVETAMCIASVDDAEITRLVQRIPDAYLPDPYRGNIISNLLSRKGQLRALLPNP
jgi:hypothetical protein